MVSDLSKSPKTGFFYKSPPAPCPYLPDRAEQKVFTLLHPENDRSQTDEVNARLTRLGFRRSQSIAYRPDCPACRACTPVRIPVQTFSPGRSQKRIIRLNRDLQFALTVPQADNELYALFSAYQYSRHPEGDMKNMRFQEFEAMLCDGPAQTRLATWGTEDGEIKAVMILDMFEDGASAVYSFYDPALEKNSPGTFMILSVAKHLKMQEKDYLYLGYWIKDSKTMAYKANFRPLEKFTPEGWVSF